MVHVLNELPGNSIMVFCATCANTQRIAFLLRNLGFTAIPLHGKLGQVLLKTFILKSQVCTLKLLDIFLVEQEWKKLRFET